MYRRDGLGLSLAAALMLVPGGAFAQQQQPRPAQAQPQPPRPLKEQLVGAWALLLLDGIKTDGTQVPLYGPNPLGSLLFTSNGRVSTQLMRTVNLAPFKSNNRDTGTADENKAVVQGTLSFFGTYTVDEADKSFTQKVEGSSFPNFEGRSLKFQVKSITDDELTFTLPGATSTIPGAGYASLEVIWRKVK